MVRKAIILHTFGVQVLGIGEVWSRLVHVGRVLLCRMAFSGAYLSRMFWMREKSALPENEGDPMRKQNLASFLRAHILNNPNFVKLLLL